MRKFSTKVGVTALSALALFALSISQAFAPLGGGGGGGGGQGTPQVDCDAGESIQAAVDIAVDGDIITVSGTCTEIVTITTDGITIRGDPGVGGTLMGGFIVDGADAGVQVTQGSFAILRGTTENPTQTITSDLASGSFGNSLGVFNDSNVRLNGGNLIVGTGNAQAIGVFNDASLRLANGLNTVTSTQDRAIGIGRLSQVSLRFFDVTGRIDVGSGSTLELRRRLNVEPDPSSPTNVVAVITGDIRVRSGAQVEFSSPFIARNLRPGGPNQGSVTVNGRLLCFGNQGRVSFSTGSGQTIQDVFPNLADLAASQCNDFNGNAVLPFVPECNDGIDNDGDGFIDLADGQCVDAADNDESS